MITMKIPTKPNDTEIFFWLDGNNVYRASIRKCLRGYDGFNLSIYLNNRLIIRRMHLSNMQVKDILNNIIECSTKKV